MVPERLVAGRHQAGRRGRISWSEQRDVMAATHELFGECVNYALGAAISSGGYALQRRGKLRNSHSRVLLVLVRAGGSRRATDLSLRSEASESHKAVVRSPLD